MTIPAAIMKGRKGANKAFRLPLLANTENRDRLPKKLRATARIAFIHKAKGTFKEMASVAKAPLMRHDPITRE